MSQELKMEWLPKLRVRYQKSSREGKCWLLDEFCADYDYGREYAIKLPGAQWPSRAGDHILGRYACMT
ncbi:MAG: hypothetical protein WCS94_00540 [Verrucomicrobiota bacterium]